MQMSTYRRQLPLSMHRRTWRIRTRTAISATINMRGTHIQRRSTPPSLFQTSPYPIHYPYHLIHTILTGTHIGPMFFFSILSLLLEMLSVYLKHAEKYICIVCYQVINIYLAFYEFVLGFMFDLIIIIDLILTRD